jgi:hypothetical protein
MAAELRIKLVALGKGLTCIGLRRISSLVKSKYPDTTTYIYNPGAVSKNGSMPLMSGDELGQMPFQDYGFDIKYVTRNSIKATAARRGVALERIEK